MAFNKYTNFQYNRNFNGNFNYGNGHGSGYQTSMDHHENKRAGQTPKNKRHNSNINASAKHHKEELSRTRPRNIVNVGEPTRVSSKKYPLYKPRRAQSNRNSETQQDIIGLKVFIHKDMAKGFVVVLRPIQLASVF
ncbi:9837_t:CDS:2 [Ambispora gerdemannii]|uniref:9837_t:CDS:1 n=1 Tax=Ambispora gerdemannii TaxID=144530 RepID=A0A9N9BL75_9GLOM|nr:9837_t:CDS:2 [Ambispora gerdemannii]